MFILTILVTFQRKITTVSPMMMQCHWWWASATSIPRSYFFTSMSTCTGSVAMTTWPYAYWHSFFSKLESISLRFREGKDIYDYVSTVDCFREALEVLLSCCFSSPVLSSLDTVLDNIANKVFSVTLAAKPCPSKKPDISCWVSYSGEVPCLEVPAKIIISHGKLTEICVQIGANNYCNSRQQFIYISIHTFDWLCLEAGIFKAYS